jgi:RNA polymerase sigma-70 factor (ECF subfamily)
MKSSVMKHELIQLGNGAHALATQILGNADDAADAVQDAFAKALQRPGAYDARRGPLKPWFLRVVRNRCLDLIRRRKQGDAVSDALPSSAGSPEQLTHESQRDHEIHLALARLSPDQRQIVVLRDYLDLSYAEIASVLEIPSGAVMSRLHRARLALKQELAAYDD